MIYQWPSSHFEQISFSTVEFGFAHGYPQVINMTVGAFEKIISFIC